MKKETKEFLKKKRIDKALPVIVKFKRVDGNFAKFPATKCDWIVKWEDVLKAFRIEEKIQ